jgi:hypothetical protein
MADWKKLAKEAILADGKVDETECKVLKKELWADNVIDAEEMEFLLDLRGTAVKKAKAKKEDLLEPFNKLFTKAVLDSVVQDGKVSGEKVQWLREKLFPGKKIDPNKLDAGTKDLLSNLNKKVKDKGPELAQLLQDTGTTAKPAPAPVAAAATSGGAGEGS